MVWGWGLPGQRVWVRFKHLTATSRWRATGRWAVKLNLADRELTPYPDNLLIGIGKPGQNLTVAFTNVAVGNVWLPGVCDGKGLPLKPGRVFSGIEKESLSDTREPRFGPRVLNARQDCMAILRADDLDLSQISVFSFYMAFNLGDGYIGVIQTAPTRWFADWPTRSTAAALPRERDDQVRLGSPPRGESPRTRCSKLRKPAKPHWMRARYAGGHQPPGHLPVRFPSSTLAPLFRCAAARQHSELRRGDLVMPPLG